MFLKVIFLEFPLARDESVETFLKDQYYNITYYFITLWALLMYISYQSPHARLPPLPTPSAHAGRGEPLRLLL